MTMRLKTSIFFILLLAPGAHSESASHPQVAAGTAEDTEKQLRRYRRRANGSLTCLSLVKIRGGGDGDVGADKINTAQDNDEATSSIPTTTSSPPPPTTTTTTTTTARTTSDIAEEALDALSANYGEDQVTDDSAAADTDIKSSSRLRDVLKRKRPFWSFSLSSSSPSTKPMPTSSRLNKSPEASPPTNGKSIRSVVQRLRQQQKDLTERFKLDLVGDVIQRQSAKAVNAVTTHNPLLVLLHLFSEPQKGFPLTLLGMWFMSIAGCAIGFHSFLYFVTVGFGLAVALVASSSLLLFNLCSERPVSIWTNVHSALPLLWALRFMTFLLHREYVNWPQWHDKIVEVNQRAKIESKFWVWSTCGMFYGTMMVPCFYRLRAAASKTELPGAKWGPFGIGAILLQTMGLVLEATADYQKSTFKAREGNRQKWCNKGLWSLSTHPNYLGEFIFWVGTYLGGIASFAGVRPWVLSSVGLLFISVVLLGAAESLGLKHMKKYGEDPEFVQFRKTHNLWGPIAF